MNIDIRKKTGNSWGFSFTTGIRTLGNDDSRPVVITNITEGGVVARDNQLRVGDVILQINDIKLMAISQENVVKILKECGNEMHLRIRRCLPTLT
ncbi:hypothetical protein I4U23_000212 [Adineta vaga]|nr:hypothetical protein I4U23_000212 [Adineta vaga]